MDNLPFLSLLILTPALGAILLARLDKPEALMSVISHETGHITGGHLTRRAVNASTSAPPTNEHTKRPAPNPMKHVASHAALHCWAAASGNRSLGILQFGQHRYRIAALRRMSPPKTT